MADFVGDAGARTKVATLVPFEVERRHRDRPTLRSDESVTDAGVRR